MQDKLVATGLVATTSVAGVSWLEYASDAATLTAAVIVGGLTAWYTWERASKLRRERKRGIPLSDGSPLRNVQALVLPERPCSIQSRAVPRFVPARSGTAGR